MIDFSLTGKTILITGASSGIGRSVAINASASGAFVVLTARNEERLQETVQKCRLDKAGIEPYELTENLDDIPRFVRRLAKKYGPFSGLVHCAGITSNLALRGTRASLLLNLFQTNSITAVMLAKGIAQTGCFNESGTSVVYLSSISATKRRKGVLGYAMSKAAIDAAVRILGVELAPDKIRLNSIRPTIIHTPMTDDGVLSELSPEQRQKLEDRHPLGLGVPEDVAGLTLFLLSDASRFINATSIDVDGGYF